MRSKSEGNSNFDQLRLMLSPSWAGNKSNVDTFTYWNVGRFPGCHHTGILVNFQTAPESYPFCSCTKLYMNRDSFVNWSGSERDIFLEEIHLRDIKKKLDEWSIGVRMKHPNILWNPGVSSSKSQSRENRTCGNFQVTAQSDVIKFLVQDQDEHLQIGGGVERRVLEVSTQFFFGDDRSNLIMFQLGWNRQLIACELD